jgi:CofD-related protein of GAK system
MDNPISGKPVRVGISRTAVIPDMVKLARFARGPDLGPKILFFSGGTALRKASRRIIGYTHNSIHIITPFDSGGSSAIIRKAFNMPAVGDIRNRLMALADQSFKGNPEIYALFSHRLPKNRKNNALEEELRHMASGKHHLVAPIPDPMRKIIRNHLYVFIEKMPKTFDLRGASVGNLILTGGYLTSRRLFDPVIYLFSKLVEVRGIVRPAVNRNYHLAARLENGDVLVGQHLITGKETSPLCSPIREVFLTDNEMEPVPAAVPIRQKMRDLIGRAELICYPMGSFFSSVIANLLPAGIGAAISRVSCPKLYVPSTANDPETKGFSLMDQIEILLHYLRKDSPGDIKNESVLNFIVVDRENGSYAGKIDEKRLGQLGLEVIDYPLVTSRSAPYIDEQPFVELLLSMC